MNPDEDFSPEQQEDEETVERFPEAPGSSRIEKFRAIVEAKSVMTIEGQPVDLTSAHVVVSIYDALTLQSNKVLLMNLSSVRKIVERAFATLKRVKERKL